MLPELKSVEDQKCLLVGVSISSASSLSLLPILGDVLVAYFWGNNQPEIFSAHTSCLT